jgi:hypothetical protein
MIPESLSPETPASERFVYKRLEAGLPETWTVVHGRRFFLPGSSPFEGELDLLVIDPARGALGLEVKGGGVERTREGWFSTDRNRVRHSIKDPGRQASQAIHGIHRFLSEARGFGKVGLRCRTGWGVVLPDVDVPRELGPDLPRGLLIDRADFADIRFAIDRVFKTQRLEGPDLSQATLQALLSTLLPTCRLIPSLAARIQQDAESLIRLTEEQSATLDMLEDNHRVAIQGSAGTGKTVLALEKARRLSEEGQRTLLLCFNRPLADHLRRFASGFEVDTFHGFCSSKANLAKVSFHIPTGGSARDFWEDEAPLKLLEALEARPDDRYDAIVVDEGQDFREHWWPSIEEALNDPAKGTLYVFFDPHQNIYGGGPPAALDIAPTRLVFNCRNTQRIAEYAGELVSASTRVRPGAPAGAAVESFACGSPEEMVSQVRKQLHRLVVEEKIAADQIVVLSTRSTKKSALAKQRKLGNLHLVDIDSPPGPAEIRFGSLQRFKGLEADVVLLVDVEAEARTSSPEHLYVGTSRARHLLLLFSAASQK